MADALSCFMRKCRAYMRPAYKQHVREFVKGGRAALVNHSLDGGVRLKDPRNRPSGDPNCELFPQDPIIPVPPSSSPYRPVGICGNNWAVSPDRHAKESLRTRRFGGRYSHYFAGGFVPRRRRNSTRRYSAAPKREFRNQLPLFSLDGSSSTVPSFQFRPLLRASHQLRPRGVIAGGLRADRKSSSKPGTQHSGGGKIYRYEIPNHVLTMGAYPNTKMMTPTGSTYLM